MFFRILSAGCCFCMIFAVPDVSRAEQELNARVEGNWKLGTERSIFMTEFWVPVLQAEDSVLYSDLRMMGDDHDNREGNLGLGYRHLLPEKKAIAGGHVWLDRRRTDLGSTFYQAVAGAEWLGETVDLRLNGYLGLSDKKIYPGNGSSTVSRPFLAGTGLFVNTSTAGSVLEEPQDGFDIELGSNIPEFDFTKKIDSIRLYGGAYYFDGPNTNSVAGWRARMTADITPDIQIGARFQRDDERGSQGFLEATVRFPFGAKKSYRREGLRARMDESPERDIDIVTGTMATSATQTTEPVLNSATGTPQEIIHVDNTAAGGGNGSTETPYNNLAAAEAAAGTHDIIYVHRGDGTSAGQNQGIVLNDTGQKLIGSGVDFLLTSGAFTTASGVSLPSSVILPATAAPILTNVNASSDAVTISADDITVSGFTIDGATRDGIAISAVGGGSSAQNITISDITVRNNRMGIYIYGASGGSVSTSVQRSVATSNSWHGIAVYDDTAGTFTADLGGGSLGSAGQNSLTGNTLEDLAVEYDGGTLTAMNNWWGQAGGPLTQDIYFGAPLNTNLVMNWTFDDGTARDRSGNGYDGTPVNGPTPTGGAFDFEATDTEYVDGPDINESDTGNALSVFARIRPESLVATQTIFSKWDFTNGPNNNTWGIRATNADPTNFYIFIADNPDVGNNFFTTSAAGLTAGVQTHIGFVYDGTGATNADRLQVYKNGLQEAGVFTGVIPANLNATAEFVNVSRPMINDPMFGQPFDGLIDDVRIYNRALSATEVQELDRMDTSSILNSTGALNAAP